MPARARTSPVRGSSAATPPSRPASADHGGLLEAGVDRGPDRPRRRAAWRAPARASPGDQLAAGAAAQPLLEHPLEPGLPDRPVRAGTRARRAACRSAGVSWAPSGPRSSPRCPRAARSAPAPAPRRAPCRRASGCVARVGGRLARVSRSPRRSSGEHEPRRPGHVLARHRDLERCRAARRTRACSTTTGTVTASPSHARRARRHRSSCAVAVAAARS